MARTRLNLKLDPEIAEALEKAAAKFEMTPERYVESLLAIRLQTVPEGFVEEVCVLGGYPGWHRIN